MIAYSHVIGGKNTEILCAHPIFPKGDIARHRNLDADVETAKIQSMPIPTGIPHLLSEGHLGCFQFLVIRNKLL